MIDRVCSVEPNGIFIGTGNPAPNFSFRIVECERRQHTSFIQLSLPLCGKGSLPLDGVVFFKEGGLQILLMPDSMRRQRGQIIASPVVVKVDLIKNWEACGILAAIQPQSLTALWPGHHKH